MTLPSRTYGPKYHTLDRHASAADIAKAVRADVKAATKTGDLGDYPPQIKFSVRSDNFAGGCSVDIIIRNAPDEWLWSDKTDPNYGDNRRIVSAEARQLADRLRSLLHAYNHDGSDTQADYWDVRFYGQVFAEGGLML